MIEAGGPQQGTVLRHTYDRFTIAFTHPELDHGHVSVQQPNLGNREIKLFRGRGLGGSTQTNFQVWSLGARHEFDAWAQAVDGPEWRFDAILDSIKKVRIITACWSGPLLTI